MTSWRLAKSLIQFRAQVDALSPKRDRTSDGSIGDLRHQSEPSDHNPNDAGVVTAFDLDNDPPHEVHCALIAEAIRSSKDDRVKYVIFNYFIMRSYAKPGIPAWTWAPYIGKNSHSHHMHISVLAERADDDSPWLIDRRATPVLP
jgi:hypothetical protein